MDTPLPASALHIPAPCHADWSAMAPQGGCRRFCDHCQHSVTDLSALPRSEAMRRLEQPDICVRYTVDAADTIVFADDCTVEPQNHPGQTSGSRRSAVKRRLARLAVLATGLATAPAVAVAGIPEAEASMRRTADEIDTASEDTPGVLDRFLAWLGVSEPEPIPETTTEPGGVVPDPIEGEKVEPRPPIRMGRPARRLPAQPFSTQGQPDSTEHAPEAPR